MAQDKDRNDAIIVRIYRGIMAEALDRDKEFLSIQVTQAVGWHAPIYAVFNNGLVYKYIPGRQPTLYDLQEPKIIQGVVQSLFRLHQTDVSLVDLLDRKGNRALYDKTTDEFFRLTISIDAIPSTHDNAEMDKVFQCYRAEFNDDVLHRELDFVVSALRNSKLPLSSIHGDLHKNNMVLDNAGKLAFIDFELSCISYRYFDLSYFFVIWRVSPWLGWCQPGEPALTPEVRRQYIGAYLEAKCEY